MYSSAETAGLFRDWELHVTGALEI